MITIPVSSVVPRYQISFRLDCDHPLNVNRIRKVLSEYDEKAKFIGYNPETREVNLNATIHTSGDIAALFGEAIDPESFDIDNYVAGYVAYLSERLPVQGYSDVVHKMIFNPRGPVSRV